MMTHDTYIKFYISTVQLTFFLNQNCVNNNFGFQ